MIVLQDTTKQLPDASIIIPTYNRISMLEEALASVFSQNFEGSVEIIVVDDHSQDGTSDLVRQKYQNALMIRLDENVGNYAARNVALVRARGKHIAFLDDDDLWEPSYLRIQLEALSGRGRAFSVSGLLIWDVIKNRKTTVTQEPDLKRYTSLIHQMMVENFIYTPSSVVFPRTVFDEVGQFDKTIRIGGDADLYMRCFLAGIYPVFTGLPLAIWRIHNEGKLTDVENFETRNQHRRVDKYYHLVKNDGIVPIQRIYAELDAHMARRFLFQRHFFKWLQFLIRCARRGYPGLAFRNVIHDMKRTTRSILRKSYPDV